MTKQQLKHPDRNDKKPATKKLHLASYTCPLALGLDFFLTLRRFVTGDCVRGTLIPRNFYNHKQLQLESTQQLMGVTGGLVVKHAARNAGSRKIEVAVVCATATVDLSCGVLQGDELIVISVWNDTACVGFRSNTVLEKVPLSSLKIRSVFIRCKATAEATVCRLCCRFRRVEIAVDSPVHAALQALPRPQLQLPATYGGWPETAEVEEDDSDVEID